MKLKLDSAAKRRNLMATTVMAGVAAFGAPAAVMLAATFAPSAALAQDYTSGTFVGHVTDSSGKPVQGAAVTVRSASTGIQQNSTTDGTGTFRAPLIPSGSYTVTVKKAGFTDIVQDGLGVRAGGESNYGFTLTNPNDVDAVVVVAKRPQPQLDFSQTTTGLSVDVEQLVKQVPLARSAQGLILLAPGTIQGAAGNYAGLTGIGGGSVSENAYYINGLNITDFNQYLGGSTVPFDFYKTFEVKTGGYPAEFGRATGGFVNATTKSGTNDLYFAVHGNFEPSATRSNQRDTYLTKGDRSDRDFKDLIIEAGLPLWKDHLFFYGLTELRDQFTSSATRSTSATLARPNTLYTTQEDAQPFYGAKIDGYLTSRQHLEATYFRTNDVTKVRSSNFNAFTDTVGTFASGTNARSGGENFVFKYTGTFTDWFTLSGAYGRTKNNLTSLPLDTTDPYVADQRTGTASTVSQQTSSSITFPYNTKRDFYRADADLYFHFFGSHHVRFGFDHEDDFLNRLGVPIGGASYTYQTAAAGNAFGLPAGQQYLDARTFIGGGTFNGVNEAFYIQDSWQLGHGLTLDIGIRDDNFNQQGEGNATHPAQTFADLNGNIGPRVGVTWDPYGDGQNKFFFNFAKYFDPIAGNTAYRNAAGILDFTAHYTNAAGYSLNPTTGLPVGGLGTQIVGFTGALPCPAGGTSTAGVVGCTIQNNGGFFDSTQTHSAELSATEEDEIILGFSHKFNRLWSASATLTYRNLVKGSDDVAIDYAVRAYCAEKGLTCDNYAGTLNDYAIINPGYAATVKLQAPLSSTGPQTLPTITFTPSELDYPKIKREYESLELTVDRAFDGKWAFHGSYTLSQLKGNYEGSSYSDYASGQVDSGVTLQFDTPTLTQGAYGLLPDHHAHVFKGYGSYQLFPNLLMGLSGTIISPRHIGCIGFDPNDPVLQNNYGPSYAHYCNGVLVPEGTALTTPWTFQLDTSARYTVPKFFKYQGDLVLRIDVFNILNQRSTTNEQNAAEYGVPLYTAPATGTTATRVPVLGQPITYQTPRYVRFGFDWTF